MIGVWFGRQVDGVVRTERIKLVAGGTQLIAIGILVGSSISPFLNTGLQVPLWARFGAAAVAGLLELGALHVLGYLAVTAPPSED